MFFACSLLHVVWLRATGAEPFRLKSPLTYELGGDCGKSPPSTLTLTDIDTSYELIDVLDHVVS